MRLKSLPKDMIPVRSTADGDCLFNSASILLFGTETVSPILRLGAVLYGVDHNECYIREVNTLETFRPFYIILM